MAEINQQREENLQRIVQDVEMDYLVRGHEKQFLDFYREWRESRLFTPCFLSGEKQCYACSEHIGGEHLMVERKKTADSSLIYYFHPGCFDGIVIKNHVKENIERG